MSLRTLFDCGEHWVVHVSPGGRIVEGEQIIRLQVDTVGERLDRYLAHSLGGLSRAQIQRLIRQGLVAVDGEMAKPSISVKPGMQVVVRVPPMPGEDVVAQQIPLDIVYEDSELLVVNKPAGMVVHPGHGQRTGTLVNALLARYPELRVGEAGRPGIVHRLDRDTSGLIVVAKTSTALEQLRRQFKGRQVHKVYLALVHGQPPAPEGIVEAPLGRDPHRRQRMAVVSGGRSARTRYQVLEDLAGYSLLAVYPETGRTHQIRVHLAWLGVPVAGDRVYGRGRGARRRPEQLGLGRQFLHAWRLSFERPGGQGGLNLEAPLPADLVRVLEALRG